jgi:pyruvate/2-oxoglutarate dehydrogenase complex dihydrolipoamide acyltransferase (E2) component
MILNFRSLTKKPFLKNVFHILPKFSFKEHLKHDINEPKAYRRILPAAKNLIKIHNISEEELPDSRIIKKEHIMQIIHTRAKAKSNLDKQSDQINTKKSQTNQQLLINLYDEVSSNKEIDYISIKNKLPHSYYFLTANVERLLRHITDINNNHKNNIKIEDFIAKVVAKIINKNNKLKILFDQTGNKFINYQNVQDVHVYLKNLHKYNTTSQDEQYVYLNPNGVALAEIAKCKKNLKETSNEKFTPIIR